MGSSNIPLGLEEVDFVHVKGADSSAMSASSGEASSPTPAPSGRKRKMSTAPSLLDAALQAAIFAGKTMCTTEEVWRADIEGDPVPRNLSGLGCDYSNPDFHWASDMGHQSLLNALQAEKDDAD